MAKQFTQLRYVGANTENISFVDTNSNTSNWSNNIIDKKYVTQLGIYALPGTTFLLN
jgi:hypothetical protein